MSPPVPIATAEGVFFVALASLALGMFVGWFLASVFMPRG